MKQNLITLGYRDCSVFSYPGDLTTFSFEGEKTVLKLGHRVRVSRAPKTSLFKRLVQNFVRLSEVLWLPSDEGFFDRA